MDTEPKFGVNTDEESCDKRPRINVCSRTLYRSLTLILRLHSSCRGDTVPSELQSVGMTDRHFKNA